MPGINNTSKGLSIAYLGAANTFLGRNTDAVPQYERALQFAKENNDVVLQVQVLIVQSQAFEKKKDAVGAMRVLNEANLLLPEGQDKLLKIDLEINLAQMYSKMGIRVRAKDLYPLPNIMYTLSHLINARFKKLLKDVPALPELLGLMSSLYKRVGNELRMLGKTNQSISMFKKAFLLHKSQDDYHGQAHSVSF